MLKGALDVTNGALGVAGAAGVPFVGGAALVLDNISKTCDEVKIHKGRTKRLSSRCSQIINLLNDQATKLEGSELQQIVDQLEPILQKILKKTRQWAQYNRLTLFVKNAEVKEGLDRCYAELETAMNLFSISSNIEMYALQRDLFDNVERNQAEMRDFILQLLRQGREAQASELHDTDPQVVRRVMEVGQEELRIMRETITAEQHRPEASPPQPHDSQRYLEYQRGLINIHRETGIPPTIKVLNGEVVKVSDLAVAGGTYSDIWIGRWLGEEKVALKALRNIRASDPRAKSRFENEVKMWSELQNDHILPFYGIVTDLGQHIHMVSPWQDNGNVLEYTKTHGDSHCMRLVYGAAQGLSYLHSSRIIHGNRKYSRFQGGGRCINISGCAKICTQKSFDKGEACICDFGMSKVIEEVTEKSASATLTAGGSARWMAPELIEGKAPTMEADTYSFAMAILELLTRKHPFADCKTTAAVIYGIVVQNKTPSRPDGFWLTDKLWELMHTCWQKDASSRPTMDAVTSCIQTIIENRTDNGHEA